MNIDNQNQVTNKETNVTRGLIDNDRSSYTKSNKNKYSKMYVTSSKHKDIVLENESSLEKVKQTNYVNKDSNINTNQKEDTLHKQKLSKDKDISNDNNTVVTSNNVTIHNNTATKKDIVTNKNTTFNKTNNYKKTKDSRYFNSYETVVNSKDTNLVKYAKDVSIAKILSSKGVNSLKEVTFDSMVKVIDDSDDTQAIKNITDKSRKIYSLTTTVKAKKAKKVVKKATTNNTFISYTTKKVSATISKALTVVTTNNHITYIIGGILVATVFLAVLISGMILGSTPAYSSYSGTGDTESMSVNEYSEVYDYVNKAIALRCLELYNLQDSYTGYLEYNYNYKVENIDGSTKDTSYYPTADISPIMAYLGVTYQSYTLDEVKTTIDAIINNLYTFDYETKPYTKTIDNGSGNTTVINGEEITFTITCHNASKYFEESDYIEKERLTAYYSIYQYGDRAYFQMYNIFDDLNWHKYVNYPYGYTVAANYNSDTEKMEYSLENQKYTTLEYKNSDDEIANTLYSPISGIVIDIKETDNYDKVITIQNDRIEFTIMADFDRYIDILVNKGDTVNAGQKIATRSYSIYISVKHNGIDTDPMLLMEYYKHS